GRLPARLPPRPAAARTTQCARRAGQARVRSLGDARLRCAGALAPAARYRARSVRPHRRAARRTAADRRLRGDARSPATHARRRSPAGGRAHRVDSRRDSRLRAREGTQPGRRAGALGRGAGALRGAGDGGGGLREPAGGAQRRVRCRVAAAGAVRVAAPGLAGAGSPTAPSPPPGANPMPQALLRCACAVRDALPAAPDEVFAAAARFASATSTACLGALFRWAEVVFAALTACFISVATPSLPAGRLRANASIAA